MHAATLQPEDCEQMAAALAALQRAVQAAIDDLDAIGPAYRPFALLLTLRSWHRQLAEGAVLLACVHALAAQGRLPYERSGWSWQAVQALAAIRRVGGEVLVQLWQRSGCRATAS